MIEKADISIGQNDVGIKINYSLPIIAIIEFWDYPLSDCRFRGITPYLCMNKG